MKAVLLALLFTATVLAQAPARDPRSGSAATGTGVIRGRVVTSDGIPVRDAEVQLSGIDAEQRRTISTDADGRFAFERVAAGRYGLMARRPPYLAFGYGQKEFHGRLETITIGSGEELNGLDIVLPRASAITGRVTNEYGEPVYRATVAALKFGFNENGLRTLLAVSGLPYPPPGPVSGFMGPVSGSRVVTDDLGQFRLFGLEPGEYVVSAVPSELGTRNGPAAAETFYPNTTVPAEAAPIRLGLAEETTIQLQLVSPRLAKVSGTVFDSRGRAAAYGLPVALRPQPIAVSSGSRTTNMRDSGEFSFDGVAPGDYRLVVSPFPNPEAYPKQPGGPEYASVPISISGGDVTDLQVTTRPLTPLVGRVSFEGTPPASIRFVDVQLIPVSSPGRNEIRINMQNADNGVRDDGSFELSGIIGPVMLQVTAPDGFMVKPIIVGGADVTDVPFDPTALGGPSEARIVLTDKVTSVSGRVASDGLDVIGAAVMIVADAPPPGALPARYMRVVRPDSEGKFSVRGLPPGRYTAAVAGRSAPLDDAAVFDPQVQDRVRQLGRSFSVREGDRVTLDLPASAGW